MPNIPLVKAFNTAHAGRLDAMDQHRSRQKPLPALLTRWAADEIQRDFLSQLDHILPVIFRKFFWPVDQKRRKQGHGEALLAIAHFPASEVATASQANRINGVDCWCDGVRGCMRPIRGIVVAALYKMKMKNGGPIQALTVDVDRP